MGYHCCNLELNKQEKTSLYDWFSGIHGEFEITMRLDYPNLAGEDKTNVTVSIQIRGTIIYKAEYRFVQISSVQHYLDETTHILKLLNNNLLELKL